jgi:hypothetical protein
MTIYCGVDAEFTADNSGSETNIGQLTSVSVSDTLELRENKVIGNANTQRSTTCSSQDWTVSISLLYDPTAADTALIRKGIQDTFRLYPQGNSSGNEVITLTNGIVSEFSVEVGADADNTASITIVSSGTNLTYGTVA